VYVLEWNGKCHNEGPGACKGPGRGSDQGPARHSGSITSSVPNNLPFLWLYQHCSTHWSTFDCFSRRDQDTNGWPSSRLINSWLSCSYCIRHVQSQEKGPLHEGMVTNQLCRIVIPDWPTGKKYSKPPRIDESSRFESLCRYSEMQISQGISESENGKRHALSRKSSDILNIWQ